jgi:hypothetical protein
MQVETLREKCAAMPLFSTQIQRLISHVAFNFKGLVVETGSAG